MREDFNSKMLGDFAELQTAAKFAEMGYFVSKPLTDNAPYDLVVDINGLLKKVQVKARTRRNDTILVELCTSMRGYKRKYSDGDFDFLVVQDIQDARLAIFDWSELRNLSTITLRMVPANSRNNNGSRLFDDFEF